MACSISPISPTDCPITQNEVSRAALDFCDQSQAVVERPAVVVYAWKGNKISGSVMEFATAEIVAANMNANYPAIRHWVEEVDKGFEGYRIPISVRLPMPLVAAWPTE